MLNNSRASNIFSNTLADFISPETSLLCCFEKYQCH